MTEKSTIDTVKAYYGRVLQKTQDLKTSACCSAEAPPALVRAVLPDIHPEVKGRFYGCGSPFPPALEGRTVLDLGCGSGRDVYVLAKLVGPSGRVLGVDMTDEQLAVARGHVDYHMRKFGHAEQNVEFVTGYIEDLAGAGIAADSIDLVVSNCVMNLSPDKPRAFAEIFRVLKPGGELYFSDVYADRRVPQTLREDPELFGECLSGALYKEDFRRLMADLGCADFRVISTGAISLDNDEVERKIGMIDFSSVTVRAFKLPLEDRCEDYGQVAYYKGSIAGHPHSFMLDDHHLFLTGKPMLVCGNTADMVSKTWYREHFELVGDKATHLGLFDCGPVPVAASGGCAPGGACC
jgi:arsenite methyltransferase